MLVETYIITVTTGPTGTGHYPQRRIMAIPIYQYRTAGTRLALTYWYEQVASRTMHGALTHPALAGISRDHIHVERGPDTEYSLCDFI
jgi:hypothetical protein